MEIQFNEQDLVDSVCVFTAQRENIAPDQVEVDLKFEPAIGISASAVALGRSYHFLEQDVIDAVAVYLRDYHQFIPESLLIQLSFTEGEGFTGSIQVKDQ